MALVLACVPATPDAIAFGLDLCDFCHMQIDDRRFAAVLVTAKGRTMKFDSIECLLGYVRGEGHSRDASAIWVSDARHPGTMLRADSARFVDLGPGRAPMGRGWAAIPTAADAAALGTSDTATVKQWSELP
jgi:copper chaperone NosL